MKETYLQRQIKEKDVRRLRNLITNKFGGNTIQQSGYNKAYEVRSEGDVWEEGGKTWTIKNGLKQTITKLDELKKTLRKPLACPECKKAMKHTLDSKFYNIHKKCFNCVVVMETRLKMEGKYEEYANQIMIKNAITDVEEAVSFISDIAKESENDFFSEAGEKNIFVGGSKKDDMIKKYQQELDDMKKQLELKLKSIEK